MKCEIRAKMLKQRLSYSKDEVFNISKEISNKIKRLDVYKKAKIIGIYMPIKNEIILDLDKTKCFPKLEGPKMEFFIPTSFVKGMYGIPEPVGQLVKKNDIDIIFVPLLAVDRKMNRIGYGKGYYDAYLNGFKGLKIGVGYNFQMVDEIDAEDQDIPLDMFITN
ncbi:MAG: 5-formyltetrahydrofolate cyclo-ligase [Bacilli bacterium]|jgi:5-formyltetrahydrofolate cyclo-ligase